jgi:hypothetical protein
MKKGILVLVAWIVGLFAIVSPWVYHLVYCFKSEKYVLLIAGAIIPPVGWLHGLGAFFGWW